MRTYKTGRMPEGWMFLTLIILIFTGCERFPPSEFELGQVKLGSAYDLYVQGEYAYVTHNEGLSIINISDLTDPEEVALVSTNEAAFGILVEEEIAYLGAGNDKFKIIDVKDKKNPKLIAELDIPGSSYGILKNMQMLYVSTWEGMFVCVDITDLSSPIIRSTIDCDGHGTSLAYRNELVYFTNPQKGLQLIDVKDPDDPVLGTTIPATSDAWDIQMKDSFIFLGRHRSGFSCIKINNDSTFSTIYSRDNGGEVYGIFKDGDRLYSADLQNGLEIWETSSSGQATLHTTLQEYSPHDVFIDQGLIFLADQDRSFVILDVP